MPLPPNCRRLQYHAHAQVDAKRVKPVLEMTAQSIVEISNPEPILRTVRNEACATETDEAAPLYWIWVAVRNGDLSEDAPALGRI